MASRPRLCLRRRLRPGNLAALAAGDGQAYNVGTGVGTSVNTLLDTCWSVSGLVVEPRRGLAARAMPATPTSTAAKSGADLGWQPKISLRDGLFLTWRYFRDRHYP